MRMLIALVALVCTLPSPAMAGDGRELAFEQPIAECEGRWVAVGRDGHRTALGFVYVDPEAGFTVDQFGHLETSAADLRAVPNKGMEGARMIHRIGANIPVACLDDARVDALGLPRVPAWMEYYRDDAPAGEHFTRWAYHYNHIGASAQALEHVASAIAAGASSTALTFEHAFALNATGRFDETLALLTPLEDRGDVTADIIAELAYAHLQRGDDERAIALYTRAIDHAQGPPSSRRAEFASNIAAAYARIGNAGQRDAWRRRADELRAETH